jgi:transposase-like protein
MTPRKSVAVETKVKAVLAALKGEKTINQIASDLEVHPVQISQWKRELIEKAPDLFRDRRTRKRRTRRNSWTTSIARSGNCSTS